MVEKKCFKCGRTLPITEFYSHPNMKDGHLNKCKECHHEDCRKYRVKMSKDSAFVEHERERSKEKDKNRKRNRRNFFSRNAQRDMKVKGIDTKGLEAHHWNYNLRRSVFLLSKRAHHCIHAMTSVNIADGYTYTKDGRRIESEHEAFSEYVSILTKYNIYNPPILVNY
jgi:hypothetical protein